MGSGSAGGRAVERGLRWPLEITEERSDGVSVLALSGRVGQRSAPQLAAAIGRLLDRPAPRLVLDFTLVDYISSAGLEVIATAASQFAAADGVLVLASVGEPVRIALDLAGLLERLLFEPSRERAVAVAIRRC